MKALGQILQETFTLNFPVDAIPEGVSFSEVKDYLLHFYDRRFQKNKELILYLGNVHQRFQCLFETNHRLRAHSDQSKEFIEMVNKDGFKEKLKTAKDHFARMGQKVDQT